MARTATTPNTLGQVGREAGQAARDVVRSPWVEALARFGLAARGVVYTIVGFLALKAAFGTGGDTTGAGGAIQTLAEKSRLLLALVAVGLFGYALWRIVQGALDPENKGSDPKGLATRAARIVSGAIYGGLAIAAVRLVSGSGASSGGGPGTDERTQHMTAGLMSQPFGRFLVAVAGLIVIGSGIHQITRGWKEKFRRNLRLQELQPAVQRRVIQAGKAGFIARGIVFVIMGIFFLQAARHANPGEARGLGGALDTLAAQPYGPWLLGLVALGLLMYGLYSFVEARYRQIVL